METAKDVMKALAVIADKGMEGLREALRSGVALPAALIAAIQLDREQQPTHRP
jgi:hypothetical protein